MYYKTISTSSIGSIGGEVTTSTISTSSIGSVGDEATTSTVSTSSADSTHFFLQISY